VPEGSAAQQGADCNTVRHIEMRFTWGVNMATDTHLNYIILFFLL